MKFEARRSPVIFFMLVLGLSIPFWLVGALTRFELLPTLPVSALMTFCPLMAALILISRQKNSGGTITLLKKTFDYKKITSVVWYVPTVLLMPAVTVLAYVLMRWMDFPMPTLQFSIPTTIMIFVVFFIGALGEELGWSGYIIDPMQSRWGELRSSIVLGLVWAVWHIIPYAQAQRSAEWIAWFCLFTVSSRVVMVWLYNNSGKSVFGISLFHATANLSWFLFPNNGSHYDPRITALIMTVIAFMTAIYTVNKLELATQTHSRKRNNFAIFFLFIFMLASTGLYIIVPVFHFASPRGPYKIGTLTYHWVDKSRPEIFTIDQNARRELMIQIWYPAKAGLQLPRTPYLRDAVSLTVSLAQLYELPDFTFKLLKYVTTNAAESAPVADQQPNYPVLIFLEGANGFRQMNTYQVEDLVSNGYIVVAIDQPYTAASVVFPDGHQALGLSLKSMKQLIRQSYSPVVPAPTLNGRAFSSGIINYLAQDVIFTLNQLEVINRADPNGVLIGKLNLDRIGTFGISLGGIIVGETCLLDLRFRACLVMDAPMPAILIGASLRQPTMWISRDSKTMQLEGWSQLEIEEHQTTMRAAFKNLKADGYFVQVKGMFHVNLTDVTLWSPLVSWLGVSGPIDRHRAHKIVNQYTLTFFNRHLNGQSQAQWSELNKEYSEVHFETRRSESRE